MKISFETLQEEIVGNWHTKLVINEEVIIFVEARWYDVMDRCIEYIAKYKEGAKNACTIT